MDAGMTFWAVTLGTVGAVGLFVVLLVAYAVLVKAAEWWHDNVKI